MQNPFSLIFGQEPTNIVKRYTENDEILNTFTESSPSYKACILTGVRGSGKTVSMTVIANELKSKNDWLVVDLSPEQNLLHALASELSGRRDLLQIFKGASISVSVMGVIGLALESGSTITDTNVILDHMLDNLTKAGKKILVTIDEVHSNNNIREFISQYQIYIRKNYNIFLLMTGLYENIYELQNEKSLTFLYRAPKVDMQPLSIPMIMKKYKEIFKLDEIDAIKMAKMTKGYPYAFQVLGYLCFKNNLPYDQVLDEFDAYLEEYVYEKIWSELSVKDKQVIVAICESASSKVDSIRKAAGMDSNLFNVYRKRLLRKGVVRAVEYGRLEFSLPRFKEFAVRSMI